MRKESSNQFTEGMVCDLNPINTPNTVLTDALNATVITYDGNEYSLQNDMGNYQLRNCRLKPNYIPVGLKEYGDILYVVSYNPLDKHVEIGSYPSPRNVEASSEDGGLGLDVQSIIGSFTGTIDYSELVKRGKLLIYTGGDEQRFKIYPGDRYRIHKGAVSEFKYETLEYFIVDENRKRYNVSDVIKTDYEFHNVPWQVPGWLAAQYRLGNFEDFIMSIRSFSVPAIADQGSIECNADLHFQFKISDELFLPLSKGTKEEIEVSENTIKSDLFIKLLIKIGARHIEQDISLMADGKFVEWYRDSKILWTNFKTTISDLNKNDNIIIEATPYLKLITNGTTRVINYDHLKEFFSFTINTIGSASDFHIGEKLWKFYAEPDGNSDNVLYMEFDVSGPAVTSDQVNLFYRLLNVSDGKEMITDGWQPVNGYNGISDQVVSWIDFGGQFKRESMYLIDFAFAPNQNTINEKYITRKLIISSSIFGTMTGDYSNFEEIPFEEWALKGYDNSLKINEIVVNTEFKAKNESATADHYWDINDKYLKTNGIRVFEEDVLNNIWSKNDKENKGWVKTTDVSKYTNIDVNVNFSKNYTATIKTEFNDVNVLAGELWKDTAGAEIKVKDGSGTIVGNTITLSRDNLSSGTKLEIDVPTKRSKTKTYTTVTASDIFKNISNLESITEIQTMWLSVRAFDNYMNDKLETKLYNTGVLTFKDDFGNNTWPTTKTHRLSVNLSEDPLPISGSMPKAILQLLGDRQIGLLGIRMASVEHKYGKFTLKHGSSDIQTFSKDGPQKLYTYLVIRAGNNLNYALMIPLSGHSELWDKTLDRTKTDEGGWHNTYLGSTINYVPIVTEWCKSFLQNVKLCTKNDSLNNFKLIKIGVEGETTQNTANYTLEISVPEKKSWLFKGFDLLDQSRRTALRDLIGLKKDNTFISGNLLNYDKPPLIGKIVKKYNIRDTGEPDLGTVVSEFDKTVISINDMISEPEATTYSSIIEKMESRTGTKGVYAINTSDKNNTLIEMLDDNYKSNTYKHINGTNTGKGDLQLHIINDNDTMVLGKVSTTVSAS